MNWFAELERFWSLFNGLSLPLFVSCFLTPTFILLFVYQNKRLFPFFSPHPSPCPPPPLFLPPFSRPFLASTLICFTVFFDVCFQKKKIFLLHFFSRPLFLFLVRILFLELLRSVRLHLFLGCILRGWLKNYDSWNIRALKK